jgi:hypothetical protein
LKEIHGSSLGMAKKFKFILSLRFKFMVIYVLISGPCLRATLKHPTLLSGPPLSAWRTHTGLAIDLVVANAEHLGPPPCCWQARAGGPRSQGLEPFRRHSTAGATGATGQTTGPRGASHGAAGQSAGHLRVICRASTSKKGGAFRWGIYE